MKKVILIGFAIIVLCCIAVAATVYYYLYAPQFHPETTAYIYVDRDDTADSVMLKLSLAAAPCELKGFGWMSRYRKYDGSIHTGRYAVGPEENVYTVFSRLYRGYQSPMNLTVGSTRTVEDLARSVARRLMIDSVEIVDALHDSTTLAQLGYTPTTLPALFVPDTYQVYWDMSAQDFLSRMQREHEAFWNDERRALADSLGLSPNEVTTLASIVEEETNRAEEKPIVAGLYLNRLRRGMLLQADPTVKFAVGDPTLRRILNRHLAVDSPYNTYLYPGLPPGPIRIATPAGIDSVLHYAHHNYLYMCAAEDFSGTHRFASTLSEHNRNAARYRAALNKRKIYK